MCLQLYYGVCAIAFPDNLIARFSPRIWLTWLLVYASIVFTDVSQVSCSWDPTSRRSTPRVRIANAWLRSVQTRRRYSSSILLSLDARCVLSSLCVHPTSLFPLLSPGPAGVESSSLWWSCSWIVIYGLVDLLWCLCLWLCQVCAPNTVQMCFSACDSSVYVCTVVCLVGAKCVVCNVMMDLSPCYLFAPSCFPHIPTS